VEFDESCYDELIQIDFQVKKEYGYNEDEILIDQVDFYALRCMGNVTFANVKPVDDPAGIVESLYAAKRDRMIAMIKFCENRGWDWDIDPYSMNVESREEEYRYGLDNQ